MTDLSQRFALVTDIFGLVAFFTEAATNGFVKGTNVTSTRRLFLAGLAYLYSLDVFLESSAIHGRVLPACGV